MGITHIEFALHALDLVVEQSRVQTHAAIGELGLDADFDRRVFLFFGRTRWNDVRLCVAEIKTTRTEAFRPEAVNL